MENNRNNRLREESERVREERRTDGQDEALNPTREAQETGKGSTPESKSTRNVNNYDEFGSKKAGPGGYGDRPHKKPVTNRKMDQDSREFDEELGEAEKQKRDKHEKKRERQKQWGE